MKQVDKVDYQVRPNENVTIRVSAVGPGTNTDFCSLSVDGADQQPVSDSPKIFRFQITASPGQTQVAGFDATFGHDADSTLSRYELFLTGDDGKEFVGDRYFVSDPPDPIASFFKVKS